MTADEQATIIRNLNEKKNGLLLMARVILDFFN